MCQIPILPNLITNVQFLCGDRILSSGAEELGFIAEIMLCSNSKNYPKLLEVYKELLEESELMLMEINAQMSEIFLMLCLDGYEEFSNCPDLYEIVLGDFAYDKLQFSEFEYHIRKNSASIIITVGQIVDNIVSNFNDDELIEIANYDLIS